MKKKVSIQQLEQSYFYSNATNALYDEWAKSYQLTYDSLFVLYAVYYEEGSCCQKRICEEWSMPKQTVHSILKGFENRGYIRFVADEVDRRNKLIFLTKEGRIYADEVIGKLLHMELAVVKRMGEKMQAYLDTSALYFQYFKEEMHEERGHD